MPSSVNMPIILSICIPTYKRAACLEACLQSILRAAEGFLDQIELVVSDNASPDETPKVIARYADAFPQHTFYRQTENIGGERNFAAVARMARGQYIWVFGDDDKMAPHAIKHVLARIAEEADLLICNYSAWEKDFSTCKTLSVLPYPADIHMSSADEVLHRFGLNLGFISSIVIRKELFFRLPAAEYEAFVQYGFPFAYAAYAGIRDGRSFHYIAEPLLYNRTANSGNYDWYKYFVTGSSLIFDALVRRGYSLAAAQHAKRGVIRQYVIHDILVRKRDRKSVQGLFSLMWPHYRALPLFWLGVVPALLVPGFIVYGSWRLMRILKRFKTHPVLA